MMRPKLTQQRKPVDLVFLKSLTVDATEIEKEIVRIFAKDDDYLADFEFTPIHIAVLDLYDASDSERPKLEDLSHRHMMTQSHESMATTTAHAQAQGLADVGTRAANTVYEKLADTQALWMYQVLRLFDGDIGLRAQAEQDMIILEAWLLELEQYRDNLAEMSLLEEAEVRQAALKSWEVCFLAPPICFLMTTSTDLVMYPSRVGSSTSPSDAPSSWATHLLPFMHCSSGQVPRTPTCLTRDTLYACTDGRHLAPCGEPIAAPPSSSPGMDNGRHLCRTFL
jgi:hypothetical protein